MDKSQILSEIKKHYSFKSDADFARFLGISAQTIFHWNKRGTFDISILVTKCKEIDPYWIVTGEGEMLKAPAAAEIEAQPDASTKEDRLLSIIESQQRTIESQHATIDSLSGSKKTLARPGGLSICADVDIPYEAK